MVFQKLIVQYTQNLQIAQYQVNIFNVIVIKMTDLLLVNHTNMKN